VVGLTPFGEQLLTSLNEDWTWKKKKQLGGASSQKIGAMIGSFGGVELVTTERSDTEITYIPRSETWTVQDNHGWGANAIFSEGIARGLRLPDPIPLVVQDIPSRTDQQVCICPPECLGAGTPTSPECVNAQRGSGIVWDTKAFIEAYLSSWKPRSS